MPPTHRGSDHGRRSASASAHGQQLWCRPSLVLHSISHKWHCHRPQPLPSWLDATRMAMTAAWEGQLLPDRWPAVQQRHCHRPQPLPGWLDATRMAMTRPTERSLTASARQEPQTRNPPKYAIQSL